MSDKFNELHAVKIIWQFWEFLWELLFKSVYDIDTDTDIETKPRWTLFTFYPPVQYTSNTTRASLWMVLVQIYDTTFSQLWSIMGTTFNTFLQHDQNFCLAVLKWVQ